LTGRLRHFGSAVAPAVGWCHQHSGRVLGMLGVLAMVGLLTWLGCRYLLAQHHFRAAEQALAEHNFTAAHDHLSRYLELWPASAEKRLLAARVARRAAAYDEAERYLNELQQRQGRMPELALERLLLQVQQGGLEQGVAEDLWSLVDKGHEEAPLILEALTRGYLYTYRLEDALRCLDRWHELQPQEVQALVWRGWIWQAKHEPLKALADYRRAVRRDPKHFQARLYLAQTLLATGQLEEAADQLEYLRQRQPANSTVLLLLSYCRRHLGQTDEACRLLDVVLAEQPDNSSALRERGVIALSQGELTQAEAWLRRAVHADPYDQEAAYQLGQCLMRLDRKEEARSYLDQADRIRGDVERLHRLSAQIAENPSDALLRCQAGIICLRNGQIEEGLRWLSGALQLDPNCQPARQALADYYQRIGKTDLAELYGRSVGKGPSQLQP